MNKERRAKIFIFGWFLFQVWLKRLAGMSLLYEAVAQQLSSCYAIVVRSFFPAIILLTADKGKYAWLVLIGCCVIHDVWCVIHIVYEITPCKKCLPRLRWFLRMWKSTFISFFSHSFPQFISSLLCLPVKFVWFLPLKKFGKRESSSSKKKVANIYTYFFQLTSSLFFF